jgi:F-type H+-transporting ATPase subunit c
MLKNVCVRLSILVGGLCASGVAFAQEHAASGGGSSSLHMAAFAVALGIAIAALGGTLGQSRAAAAALEGICRNPSAADKVSTPMMLSLVFMESLVLFTWALMFLLLQKI